MARAHGKDADVTFNTTAIEDELQSIGLSFSVPPAEITAFADAWQNFLSGKPTLVIDGAGYWDPASSQGDAALFAALGGVALVYNVEPDGATGYDGFGILTSYNIQATVSGPITYDYTQLHNAGGAGAAADGSAPRRA